MPIPRLPAAPRVITFEGLSDMTSKWTWRLVRWGCPNKGDYYMSGAEPQAYKARQHLTMEYWIVEPLYEHTLQSVWLPKLKV